MNNAANGVSYIFIHDWRSHSDGACRTSYQGDESCPSVPRRVTNLLRHHPELGEEDGAVEWNELLFHFKKVLISLRMSADGGRKNGLIA